MIDSYGSGDVPLNIDKLKVLGIGVSAVSLSSTVDKIANWVERRRHPAYVVVAAVHSVMDAQDDIGVKNIMRQADLCVPDGVPLVWLLRRAGFQHVTRVFGPDLMLAVCERLSRSGGRMFYYGGKDGVALELANEMERRYPGIITAGSYTPPFRPLTPSEEEEVACAIEETRPDVLWVGLSSPKQELWMGSFRRRLSVPVMIGVGAAFDYNTGRLNRAPAWMQKSALEWLYRTIQEPRRLAGRYFRNNPRFLWNLMAEACGLRKFD